MDSLYGLVVHKFNFDTITYPQFETHNTLVDIALDLSHLVQDKVNDEHVGSLVESISIELDKLKQVCNSFNYCNIRSQLIIAKKQEFAQNLYVMRTLMMKNKILYQTFTVNFEGFC
jgi:hypothetical protein